MNLRHSICIIPAMLLAACGGGGGGGGDEGSQASAVVITEANAQAVSADALDASTNLGAAGDPGVVLGVQVQGAAASNPTRLAAVARRLAAMAPTTALATGVAVNETLACDSGSINVSGDVSGGTALVAGDRLTFNASSCVIEDMRLNGSMTINVTRGPYDPDSMVYPKRVSMTISARNFSLLQGGVTTSSTGAMELALDETNATTSTSVVTITAMTNKVGNRSTTLKDYTQTATVSGDVVSVEASGTVESENSRLGSGVKRYTIRTIAPLTTTAGAFTSGTLEAAGGSATKLRLVVSASDTFTLQMDLDGNGSFEKSDTATRAELEDLL